LEVEDPKINSNSMVWDMSQLGTKNYSFRINGRNTEKMNSEWQIAESQWNAVLNIHLSSQGDNYIHKIQGQTSNFVLGEFKYSFFVMYIQTDSPHDNLNRITHSDLLSYIRVHFSGEILEGKYKKKLEELVKEKKNIDLMIEKVKTKGSQNVEVDPTPSILEDVE
jgi:hypothetical protein